MGMWFGLGRSSPRSLASLISSHFRRVQTLALCFAAPVMFLSLLPLPLHSLICLTLELASYSVELLVFELNSVFSA